MNAQHWRHWSKTYGLDKRQARRMRRRLINHNRKAA